MPQPMVPYSESIQMGTWTPAVFTCAMMHAETRFWQPRSAPPFFHCVQRPMLPGKV